MSRYTTRTHRFRADDPAEYADRLAAVVAEYGYDYVIPVGGRTTEIVSEYRDEIPVPLDPILPPKTSLRRAIDKHDLYLLADDMEIPRPTSVRIQSSSDIPRAIETVGESGVFKTGSETEPRFLRYVESPTELQAAYRAYVSTHESAPLYQEYLSGRGRGFFGFYLDGTCHGYYAHRRIREAPPSGGKSVCAESLLDPELYDYADPLLSALDWNGVVMLEFKNDAAGNPYLLECNPKFWGSMALGVISGMNFPRALVEYLVAGTTPEFEFTPARVHWPLSGDLLHALARPASVPAVMTDLASRSTNSNIRLSDPLPHVSEAVQMLVSTVVSVDGPINSSRVEPSQ
ncbi:ATP-grasp domain-containing protein [Haloarcula nitratireducens]|uniref:ATP-grasp domain-containing protein n=1 Tax=Haloarcula nitratireducens TaxID=2487749 RepID=A0AAW4PH06_9EURY|nr:ATP-grasp domain-containing protein [Halomicroarcula nitratireducens]MBX0297022.1 ATP-grasp domain-containing protein [Halomicroarcula nitratireducens]